MLIYEDGFFQKPVLHEIFLSHEGQLETESLKDRVCLLIHLADKNPVWIHS